MNKILRKIRPQIGILFIVSLSSIIIVNILCDCDIIGYGENYYSTHSPNDLNAHDHSDSSEQPDDQHTHYKDNNVCTHHNNCNDSHKEADTCCEDFTQSILSNLVKPRPVSFSLDFQPFALYSIFPTFQADFIFENLYTHVRELTNPPPISGMELRIKIQSFRN